MWSFISRLVLRLAAVRWLFKLGGLGLLLPIALVLKTIGLPLLIILMILALPVLVLLLLFGLPIFLVFLAGSAIMGLIGLVLTMAVAALKFAIFIVLPAWLIWKLACAIFRRRPRGGDASDTPPPDASTNNPASSSEPPVDPLVDPLD
jgi:hypothetical protein